MTHKVRFLSITNTASSPHPPLPFSNALYLFKREGQFPCRIFHVTDLADCILLVLFNVDLNLPYLPN